MNIYISADIEGVCGVMARTHWDSEGSDYKRACGWMMEEVNAAIRGALAAGAKRVVVKDSHHHATNLNLADLHPAAELISGWGPLRSMVEGIDASFHALFLIGYHARASTRDGTLAHTWGSHVLDLQINQKRVGETGLAAAYAGHFGVPLALVTGDDKLAAQVAEEIPKGVHSVVTKTGWAYNACWNRPMQVVRQEIEEAAERALADVKSLPVFKPKLPATLTLRFRDWEGLDACAAVPGVERVGVDTFQCRAADAIELQKYFVTLQRLARSN